MLLSADPYQGMPHKSYAKQIGNAKTVSAFWNRQGPAEIMPQVNNLRTSQGGHQLSKGRSLNPLTRTQHNRTLFDRLINAITPNWIFQAARHKFDFIIKANTHHRVRPSIFFAQHTHSSAAARDKGPRDKKWLPVLARTATRLRVSNWRWREVH